ncbi:MAG: hypothetical protein U0936_01895 [Planctomycetaceae bacterium]
MSSRDRANDAVLRVLFVCTGNTCRSPMAETIFRQLVAEKLSCRDWELRERRIDVFSAGIAAGESDPATREAIVVMQECGLDMPQHLSQQFNEHVGEFAGAGFDEGSIDVFFGENRAGSGGRVRLLSQVTEGTS